MRCISDCREPSHVSADDDLQSGEWKGDESGERQQRDQVSVVARPQVSRCDQVEEVVSAVDSGDADEHDGTSAHASHLLSRHWDRGRARLSTERRAVHRGRDRGGFRLQARQCRRASRRILASSHWFGEAIDIEPLARLPDRTSPAGAAPTLSL